MTPAEDRPRDHVDQIVAQWAATRPDLDASSMGVIGRISRLGVLLVKEQAHVFAKYGLDFAAFDVLATLRRTGAPFELTPGQLAASMMVTPGTVTQRLTRLEDAGLISRSHQTTDRRVVTVSLCDTGLELVDTILPAHLANEHRLLAGFTPDEQVTLASLLRRLLVDLLDVPEPVSHDD